MTTLQGKEAQEWKLSLPPFPIFKGENIAIWSEQECQWFMDESYKAGQKDIQSRLEQGIKPPHKCIPIARAAMSEGRDWWLGKLTEKVAEFPVETHCLHLKTPLKDVVFLCNSGDFQQLSVLCRHALGYAIDEDWMQTHLEMTEIPEPSPTNNTEGGVV